MDVYKTKVMGVRNTFVKSFGLYFLGNILSKIIMFILLPVYTDYLPPEELGYYDVANTYLNLLVTFLFVDIYVGIMQLRLCSTVTRLIAVL